MKENVLKLVSEHFECDTETTILWFITKNPLLGNVAPLDMIRNGREDKLCKFIKNCLDGNLP